MRKADVTAPTFPPYQHSGGAMDNTKLRDSGHGGKTSGGDR